MYTLCGERTLDIKIIPCDTYVRETHDANIGMCTAQSTCKKRICKVIYTYYVITNKKVYVVDVPQSV
jgi:hypothetical protein